MRVPSSRQDLQDETWNSNIIETSSLNQVPTLSLHNKSPGKRSTQSEKRILRTNKRNKATKTLILQRHPEIGFGFSIRGGIEHGTGIFISNINKYSDAFGQGLQIGDQILKANKFPFVDVSHDEIVQFIQRHKSLKLVILSLGITPGSKIAQNEYQWIDCYGRPCSPLNLYLQGVDTEGCKSNEWN